MDKYSTPEERLLHLIRRKDAKQKASGQEGEKKPQAAIVSKPRSQQRPNIFTLASFKNFKTILVVIAILLVLYILLELLFFRGNEGKLSRSSSRRQGEDTNVLIQPANVKPYSYYANQFNERDIFEANPSVGNIAKSSTASTGLQQLTKNLKLVGVILDNNPQAIIENSAENKTYFLRKGELINNLKLEVITESKVILSDGNEKLELAL